MYGLPWIADVLTQLTEPFSHYEDISDIERLAWTVFCSQDSTAHFTHLRAWHNCTH